MSIMNQNNMRKLVVSEWMTLDGVFDADTMDKWWIPYDSVERQEYIKDVMRMTRLKLVSTRTYPSGVMALAYQPTPESD